MTAINWQATQQSYLSKSQEINADVNWKINLSPFFIQLLHILIACIPALYVSPAFSAKTDAVESPQWSVCIPFMKIANDRRQIPEDALESELAKFPQPEKEVVPRESAAYLYLADSTMGRKTLEEWQWNSIKKTIDRIYAGETTASRLLVDVNNNGSLEHVIEFRSPPPFARSWNYVLNEEGGFHADFIGGLREPKSIFGELRTFNGKTYIFDITNPVNDPATGRPLKRPFNIYRPKTSAMMKDAGVSEYGLHKSLCEFEIINP
ncbi:hypothetical protein [Pseudomonas indica]|uniref:hypothetical protein n=1 Tax=Pseudomonas indica TaxID=137658 RepID=UPI0023F888B9|nr:hypothetical protein [Pseudomonas indica]MBU3054992.1 hypothetical protein [Pseudomonas indica]